MTMPEPIQLKRPLVPQNISLGATRISLAPAMKRGYRDRASHRPSELSTREYIFSHVWCTVTEWDSLGTRTLAEEWPFHPANGAER